jgi:hypothetical protein
MSVLTCGQIDDSALASLLEQFGLRVVTVAPNRQIPGSHWGEPEAGLIGRRLFVRADTPVHSALHEACHYACMDTRRRASLHTDAGGDDLEETGVCYLSVLLADHVPEFGRQRMLLDMDRWGYSFRLGSARRWFADDARDARDWLLEHGLLTPDEHPTWRVRT